MQFHDWQFLPQRVAIHRPTATAVVSDLHLGYRAARQQGGEAIPDLSLQSILDPLRLALQHAGTRRLLVAGDLFESAPSEDLIDQFQGWLINANLELIALIPGNHDRGLALTGKLPLARNGYTLGQWQVIHGDRRGSSGPCVQGHDHPCLRWNGLVAPCFLYHSNHLVLPAYSLDAAGVNVLGNPRWKRHHCAVIAREQVLDFGLAGSLAQKLRISCARGR